MSSKTAGAVNVRNPARNPKRTANNIAATPKQWRQEKCAFVAKLRKPRKGEYADGPSGPTDRWVGMRCRFYHGRLRCYRRLGAGSATPAADSERPNSLCSHPRRGATGPFPANAFVTYDNGPVLVNPKMYLILWGYKRYGDPENVASLLEAFAKNMGGSSHNNIYTQYYEISDSQKAYITNAPGSSAAFGATTRRLPRRRPMQTLRLKR